jgi:hypothetical protein
MAETPKKNPGGLFGNDDLDEDVASADDTGIVKQQQEVAEEEILSNLEED